MSRSVALGEHFEEFIDEQVKSGRFNNASEVMRAGLRLLEDSEKMRALRLEELRRLIRDGESSGQPVVADEVFDRLEAKYAGVASSE